MVVNLVHKTPFHLFLIIYSSVVSIFFTMLKLFVKIHYQKKKKLILHICLMLTLPFLRGGVTPTFALKVNLVINQYLLCPDVSSLLLPALFLYLYFAFITLSSMSFPYPAILALWRYRKVSTVYCDSLYFSL